MTIKEHVTKCNCLTHCSKLLDHSAGVLHRNIMTLLFVLILV